MRTQHSCSGVNVHWLQQWLLRASTLAFLALVMGCGGDPWDDDFEEPPPPPKRPEIEGPDPLFSRQWHLENRGQSGGIAGEDARVIAAWELGYDGSGVRIVVVDDGLEVAHEDLEWNVVDGASINYVDLTSNPTTGEHGTAVAAVAAARGNNSLGVSGAAPRADLVGYNFLANPTIANLIDAMTRDVAVMDISNNSWGYDGGAAPVPSRFEWRNAVELGLLNGRGGRGTIYVFAAGNDANINDNANYDGYASFYGIIAVGAVGDKGRNAWYSEPGANVWISAPSSGNGQGITTGDRSGSAGYNPDSDVRDYDKLNYTKTFGGTSSAAPLVSGVVALILDANAELSWRDVRLVIAESARRNHPAHPDWRQNAAGFWINHQYGFGVIDAESAVGLALHWDLLPPLVTYDSVVSQPGLPIPDNNATGVTDTITVSGSGIVFIEHVAITFSAPDHTYFPDLQIRLTSPSGTVSVLAETHTAQPGAVAPSYGELIFGTVRALGEPANGTWNIHVADRAANDQGTLSHWNLRIRGH